VIFPLFHRDFRLALFINDSQIRYDVVKWAHI